MSVLPSPGKQIWAVLIVLIITVLVAVPGVVAGWNWLNRGISSETKVERLQPLAVVNGVAVTPEMVERELHISRLNVADPLPPLTGADLDRAQAEALNQLIDRQLILQEASRQGFSLAPELVEERADLLFGAYGDDALDQALAQVGAFRSDLLWWVGEIFTVEEFTIQVIMAGAAPEDRQQVYNEWFNRLRAQAQIETYAEGEVQTTYALVGEPAPDFTLTAIDGQAVSLSGYDGKVVLLNFWATWCPSCITEMPIYEQLYRQYGPEFVVLGVNLQESQSHVRQYAEGLGVTFPVLLDSDGQVTTRQYQVTGMPGSFIIDRQGRIFYRHLGPLSGETLRAKLAELGL